jgi:hypothetical protein
MMALHNPHRATLFLYTVHDRGTYCLRDPAVV